MRFSVSGDLNGRTETFSADTAAEAAAHAQRLRRIGAGPIHIARDGRPLTDFHEFQRLVEQDGGAWATAAGPASTAGYRVGK